MNNDITMIFTISENHYKKLMQLREQMELNNISKEEFYKQVFIAGINNLLKQTK